MLVLSLLVTVFLRVLFLDVVLPFAPPRTPQDGPTVAIGLHVDLPDGRWADVRIPDRQSGRVVVAGGPARWLVPRLEGEVVDLAIWDGDPAGPGDEARLIANLRLEPGVPVVFTDAVTLRIEWRGTFPPPSRQEADGPCHSCCVTCGDVEWCACRVTMACGECCCPTACSCIWTPACVAPATSPSRTPGGSRAS